LNNGSGRSTAVGSKAGVYSTGENNTFIGYHAGNNAGTGSSNTIVGYGADINDGALSNATAIGNSTVVGASDRVRLGNTSVTSIGGQVAWSVFSDERMKTNIKENVPGLKFINLLKPITYNYDIDKEQSIMGVQSTEKWARQYDITRMQFTGFSAQQVENAAKQIEYDFSGVDAPKNDKDMYALRYSDFVVPLVKAVQELSKINDDKSAAIDSLQKQHTDQQRQIDDLKNLVLQMQQQLQRLQRCSQCGSTVTVNAAQQNNIILTDAASLQQNIPNPFTNTTTISYSLPNKFSSAKIIITDKNGKQLKQLNLPGAGKGTIHVDASILASGAYNYSLFVDGRLIASKEMVLTK